MEEGRQAGWPTDISNAPEESDKTKDFVNAKRSHRKGEKVREFRKQPVSQSVSYFGLGFAGYASPRFNLSIPPSSLSYFAVLFFFESTFRL